MLDCMHLVPPPLVDCTNALYQTKMKSFTRSMLEFIQPMKVRLSNFIIIRFSNCTIIGSISSAQISYDKETSTLTCTSTGGPATTVTWSKDGNPVQVDGQTLQQVQEVMDTSSATYQSRLTIVNKGSNLSGSYKCTVTNARGNISSGNIPVTGNECLNMACTVWIIVFYNQILGPLTHCQNLIQLQSPFICAKRKI